MRSSSFGKLMAAAGSVGTAMMKFKLGSNFQGSRDAEEIWRYDRDSLEQPDSDAGQMMG